MVLSIMALKDLRANASIYAEDFLFEESLFSRYPMMSLAYFWFRPTFLYNLRVMSDKLPPPGGNHDRGADTYGAIISFPALSTASVLAWIYARINLIHKVGWDDYTILEPHVESRPRFLLPMVWTLFNKMKLTFSGITSILSPLPFLDVCIVILQKTLSYSKWLRHFIDFCTVYELKVWEGRCAGLGAHSRPYSPSTARMLEIGMSPSSPAPWNGCASVYPMALEDPDGMYGIRMDCYERCGSSWSIRNDPGLFGMHDGQSILIEPRRFIQYILHEEHAREHTRANDKGSMCVRTEGEG